MTSKTKVDPSALDFYELYKAQFIPLHKWDDVSKHKNGKERQDGKRPLHSSWTTKQYNNDKVRELMETEGNNVGIRLTAEQLVVDVDPRNFPFGIDSFAELCKAIDLKPSEHAVVNTGSGGLHVYMLKPPGLEVVDSLEGYDGVEFKSLGRQVVAAGSVHPCGKGYEWELFQELSAGTIRMAPEGLLHLIKRPPPPLNQVGGGEYSQEDIAKQLNTLDPEDFRDQSAWLALMMSCHHASNGDARSEFIEWSTRDPAFVDDAWIIGRRWDSLHSDKTGRAVTAGTLHYHMQKAGQSEHIIPMEMAFDPETEFDHDDDVDEILGRLFVDDVVDLSGFNSVAAGLKNVGGSVVGSDDDEIGSISSLIKEEDFGPNLQLRPLEKLNDKFTFIRGRNAGNFAMRDRDYHTGSAKWTYLNSAQFDEILRPIKLKKADPSKVDKDGNPKITYIPISKAWRDWEKKRSVKSVIMDPSKTYVEGHLNLWEGWSVQPAIGGDWSNLKFLIEEVLCDGNREASEYVFNWIAFMVQKPEVLPEVAICFHGDKGTGKSTLGNVLCELAGMSGLSVSSADQLTGRFNGHLRNVVMLFADEAVEAGSRQANNTLKTLLTEKSRAYEAKGADIERGPNFTHLMLASNDDWFVKIGLGDGERRFFVSRCNNRVQKDKVFFMELYRQLNCRGRSGMKTFLHDMLSRKLTKDWHPRDNVPMTSAMAEQAQISSEPIGRWWIDVLEAGDLGCPFVSDIVWTEGNVKVFKVELRDAFRDWCKTKGINPGASGRDLEVNFSRQLSRLCPNLKKHLKATVDDDAEFRGVKPFGPNKLQTIFKFPSLKVCRADFERVLGYPKDWD